MEEIYPKFNAAEAEVIARIERDGLPGLTAQLRTMVSTVEEMEWGPDAG